MLMTSSRRMHNPSEEDKRPWANCIVLICHIVNSTSTRLYLAQIILYRVSDHLASLLMHQMT